MANGIFDRWSEFVSQEWRNGAAIRTKIVSKFHQMATVLLSQRQRKMEVHRKNRKKEMTGLRKWQEKRETVLSKQFTIVYYEWVLLSHTHNHTKACGIARDGETAEKWTNLIGCKQIGVRATTATNRTEKQTIHLWRRPTIMKCKRQIWQVSKSSLCDTCEPHHRAQAIRHKKRWRHRDIDFFSFIRSTCSRVFSFFHIFNLC